MAKEIVTWCEIHLQDKEERVPGREREIALDGKSQIIDVCPDCEAQHIAPLEALLAAYGQDVTPKPAKKKSGGGSKGSGNRWTPDADGKFRCRAPIEGGGECLREFDTAQAIGRHNLSHGENAA
jgi:hypothetical protein